MKAIYKRELRAYFTSMLGYSFLTIFLLITGIQFYRINIGNNIATMARFFDSVLYLIMFFLPLLTIRLFAEDRKQKTDQLLFTAPISVWDIVLGKFFAAFTVFIIGTVITAIYPIIIMMYGKLPVGETLNGYLGFILFSSMILAIGSFMSSVTENQVIAAIATYGVIILIVFIDVLPIFIANEAVSQIFVWLSPIRRFTDFSLGLLNPEPIIYYLSLTGLFVFFTGLSLEKRRLN
ncbi:MAG: ABC transporter permease [Clostridia bacterium]|nr:ABC transporter permease [Clostridia bacterium]MBQ9599592.1 ABC transporter permease [Clostridia bacterium]